MNKLLLSILFILSLSLISCKKELIIPESSGYKNIVIIGNELVYSVKSKGEWTGGRGMAATTPENDFAHLLDNKFKAVNSEAKVTVRNISKFDSAYAIWDIEANLSDLGSLAPDLIIIKVGENIPYWDSEKFNKQEWENSFGNLVSYLKNLPSKPKVVIVGTIFSMPSVESAMLDSGGDAYVSINYIGYDFLFLSYGKFHNPYYEKRPNDKGMKFISYSIWDTITKL